MALDLTGKVAVHVLRQNSRTCSELIQSYCPCEQQLGYNACSVVQLNKQSCNREDDSEADKPRGNPIVLFTVFIWFTGYFTGAEVTRIWKTTKVIYDCIFLPATEDSGRV